MPGTRHTDLNAYRQLVAVQRHDHPQHFAEAMGGPLVADAGRCGPGTARSAALSPGGHRAAMRAAKNVFPAGGKWLVGQTKNADEDNAQPAVSPACR